APLFLRERDYGCRDGAHSRPQPARTTLHPRQRPASSQQPPQEIRRRDRPLGLVGPQAPPLTRSFDTLRSDALAIVQAAIRAVDPVQLVDIALRGRARSCDFRTHRAALIAAGKAAEGMTCGALTHVDARSAVVIGPEDDASGPLLA